MPKSRSLPALPLTVNSKNVVSHRLRSSSHNSLLLKYSPSSQPRDASQRTSFTINNSGEKPPAENPKSGKAEGEPDVLNVLMVDWAGADDPLNPKNWSYKKNVVTDLTICVFVLAYAIGPLFLGPLSEIFGARESSSSRISSTSHGTPAAASPRPPRTSSPSASSLASPRRGAGNPKWPFVSWKYGERIRHASRYARNTRRVRLRPLWSFTRREHLNARTQEEKRRFRIIRRLHFTPFSINAGYGHGQRMFSRHILWALCLLRCLADPAGGQAAPELTTPSNYSKRPWISARTSSLAQGSAEDQGHHHCHQRAINIDLNTISNGNHAQRRKFDSLHPSPSPSSTPRSNLHTAPPTAHRAMICPTGVNSSADGHLEGFDIGSRSALGIAWTCLVIIFACTWTAIHPNVPAKDVRDSGWKIQGWRIAHSLWALLVPELMVMWAVQQWAEAKQVSEAFRKERARKESASAEDIGKSCAEVEVLPTTDPVNDEMIASGQAHIHSYFLGVDISQPRSSPDNQASSVEGEAQQLQWTKHRIFNGGSILDLHNYIVGEHLHVLKGLHDEDTVQRNATSTTLHRHRTAIASSLVTATAFGGVHCVAWDFEFTTHAEHLVWDISAAHRKYEEARTHWRAPAMLRVVLSVLLLVVVCVDLSPGARAIVDWSSFIPHI
ncbi:hypothetical protein AB1N83_003919 [Pleurotus pulmonarius]